MHRGLYKAFDVDKGYIKDLKTGENIGTHLDLYCYTADANNVYYDEPHIDYPSHYVHVVDSKETNVAAILERQGMFEFPYIIVSRLKRISGFERFHIDDCNSFFSMKTTDDAANLLISAIGIENLYIVPIVFDMPLLKIKDNPRTPYDILFFVDSNDATVQARLNSCRRDIVLQVVQVACDTKKTDGVTFCIDGKLANIGGDKAGCHNLEAAIRSNGTKPLLTSDGNTYMLDIEELKSIKEKMDRKNTMLDAYFSAYKKMLESTMNDEFKIGDWKKYPEFLREWYTTPEIVKEVQDAISKE